MCEGLFRPKNDKYKCVGLSIPPNLSSLRKKKLDYTLKASHPGLFLYSTTSPPEADHQVSATKELTSSNHNALHLTTQI